MSRRRRTSYRRPGKEIFDWERRVVAAELSKSFKLEPSRKARLKGERELQARKAKP